MPSGRPVLLCLPTSTVTAPVWVGTDKGPHTSQFSGSKAQAPGLSYQEEQLIVTKPTGLVPNFHAGQIACQPLILLALALRCQHLSCAAHLWDGNTGPTLMSSVLDLVLPLLRLKSFPRAGTTQIHP